MPASQPRIYIAGPSAERQRYRDLHEQLSREHNIVSDWPFLPETLSGQEEVRVWSGIEKIIRDCDILFVPLAQTPLRGALVEVGMAIAFGKKIVVEQPDPLPTWCCHFRVHLVHNFGDAMLLLRRA